MKKPIKNVALTPQTFDAFNARFINPADVARTFVPPPQFDQLIEANHSVLSGPRGSGKTTLLKMVTLEGLSAWGRGAYIRRINYTSIFVGADILWTGQMDAIAGVETPAEIKRQAEEALFRLHICFSALDTLESCRGLATHSDAHLSRFAIVLADDEASSLVRELAAAWGVTTTVDSFRALRSALRTEVGEIERFVKAARRGDTNNPAPRSLGISWLSAITSFVDLVNTAIDDRERQWALLVDELEITRPQLRDEVFASLRSTDQRLIFKLALFPFQVDPSPGQMLATPSPSNDYQPIVLWYARKEQSFAFCEALLRMLVREEGGGDFKDPEDIFGVSRFDGGRHHRRTNNYRGTYAPGGPIHSEFSWLRQNDPSFAEFLNRRKIDIEGMADMPENERAAKVRKLLPLTTVRRHFLKPDASWADQRRQRVRSTQGFALYTGAYALFALSEGNPRVFINLARPLVRAYVAAGGRAVGREVQARHVEAVLERFRTYIAGTPYVRTTAGASVWDFVESIGSFFENRVLFEPFRADAPLQFEVDANASLIIQDLVGRAVNLGLVVPMTGGNRDAVFRDLSNVRFRLAYTICPYFRLPLATTGTAASISAILRSETGTSLEAATRRRQSELDGQMDLLGGQD
jgi:hypothetical protein